MAVNFLFAFVNLVNLVNLMHLAMFGNGEIALCLGPRVTFFRNCCEKVFPLPKHFLTFSCREEHPTVSVSVITAKCGGLLRNIFAFFTELTIACYAYNSEHQKTTSGTVMPPVFRQRSFMTSFIQHMKR